MQVVEVGVRARAALERASRCDVLMRFSRGVVLVAGDEVVWVDVALDAFSPCGVLVASTVNPARNAGSAPHHTPRLLDRAFLSATRDFLHELQRGTSIAAAAAILVGLGHGLTPSGDDYLGGFLALRHSLGHRDVVDTSATHQISRARLTMHMRGEGTRAELRFIAALRSRTCLRSAYERLRNLGSSSGRDFARGAIAAMRLAQ